MVTEYFFFFCSQSTEDMRRCVQQQKPNLKIPLNFIQMRGASRVCVCVSVAYTHATRRYMVGVVVDRRRIGQQNTEFLVVCLAKPPQEKFTRCFYRISRNQQRTNREKKKWRSRREHDGPKKISNNGCRNVVVFMVHTEKRRIEKK